MVLFDPTIDKDPSYIIKSFIFSEMNIFGLPKFNKTGFAFVIFVPIPVQGMVY